jgi:hypothetical protein
VSIDWPTPAPGPDDTGPLAGRVRVYLAIPTPADAWDTARWDRARWDAGGAEVVDVTCLVDGVDITYGRDDTTSHASPIAARFAVNNESGAFTPWANTAHRRRRWYLGAPVYIASETGPLFTGYVQAMSELDAAISDENRLTAFNCLGPAGFLAQANGLEQPAQGGGELAGARLNRICDNAMLPAWVTRDFRPGIARLQATTLAGGALTECWLTADSDGGAFLELADGTLQYLDGATLDNQPRYTEPQATFTDDHPPAGTVECMTAYTATLSTDHVYTAVSIAAAGGTEHVASRPADEWAGARTFQRHDLIYADEPYGDTLALSILARLDGAELLVEPLDFDPLLSDANWNAAHHLRPYDRIRIVRTRTTPDGTDQLLDMTATVDQIHHSITNLVWTTTVTSSPGTQRFDFTRWDVARWDRDPWE